MIFHVGRRLAELGKGMDSWIDNNLVRVIEDETKTLFSSDPWLKGGLLCHRFCCLFDLTENRLGLVVDMSSLG